MLVLGYRAVGRDPVNIHVENRFTSQPYRHSRFLFGLALGHGPHVGVAVAVAAGLEPAVEFAVVQQQDVPARRVEYPGRGRDVPDQERTLEAVGMAGNESRQAYRQGGFVGVGGGMASE